MTLNKSKQRLYASLLMLGAGILLFRTIMMLYQGALEILVLWVSALLIFELLIDLSCLISSARWWIANDKDKSLLALRLGAAAAIFHAFRVLIFVMGRFEPWLDFDVRPEQRALHHTHWSWEGVYFAAIMSILGVIGVIVIWRLSIRAKKMKHEQN